MRKKLFVDDGESDKGVNDLGHRESLIALQTWTTNCDLQHALNALCLASDALAQVRGRVATAESMLSVAIRELEIALRPKD